MPVTTFVTVVLLAIFAATLAVWSVVTIGAAQTVPVLIVLALAAIWGFGTVSADDDTA